MKKLLVMMFANQAILDFVLQNVFELMNQRRKFTFFAQHKIH